MGLIADMLLEFQKKQTNQIESKGTTSPFVSRYYLVSPDGVKTPVSKYAYGLYCGEIFKGIDKL